MEMPTSSVVMAMFQLSGSICQFDKGGLGLWCLAPLSTIFHLYRGGVW